MPSFPSTLCPYNISKGNNPIAARGYILMASQSTLFLAPLLFLCLWCPPPCNICMIGLATDFCTHSRLSETIHRPDFFLDTICTHSLQLLLSEYPLFFGTCPILRDTGYYHSDQKSISCFFLGGFVSSPIPHTFLCVSLLVN